MKTESINPTVVLTVDVYHRLHTLADTVTVINIHNITVIISNAKRQAH